LADTLRNRASSGLQSLAKGNGATSTTSACSSGLDDALGLCPCLWHANAGQQVFQGIGREFVLRSKQAVDRSHNGVANHASQCCRASACDSARDGSNASEWSAKQSASGCAGSRQSQAACGSTSQARDRCAWLLRLLHLAAILRSQSSKISGRLRLCSWCGLRCRETYIDSHISATRSLDIECLRRRRD
jgi:hypothetical protein